MTRSYERSLAQLERASRTIPLGSQTFSKSRTAFPVGASPLYVERGEGGRVVDVDGNEYVDLVCGLACVTLGYRDADVDAAVREQLDRGVTFSLPHTLESEVAEALVECIPCAQQVRFGKNGSDATTAAMRLARAWTGRDRIVMCGYHGWQDWSIGTTSRHAGVPAATRALTTTFAFNDLDSLDAALAPGDVAAVILEPTAAAEPEPGFLAGVVERARAAGALAVFDETVTGFRMALGGVQASSGVTPDLATFGKGIANGLPLSAIVGRADVMHRMEEIFFSTTFGGETLSLAAARAVLAKMHREPVIETLAERGRTLRREVEQRIETHGATQLAHLSGHPAWTFFHLREAAGYTPFDLRTLFMQEMAERGILTLGTHNVCYAHTDEDVRQVLDAYDAVLPLLVEAVERRDLRERLRCEPLAPLFRPR